MRRKLSRRVLLASAPAAAAAPWLRGMAPAAVQAKTPVDALPPIDTAGIAQRVVKSLAPRPGERVVLVFDPAYYPDLAAAIERELVAKGAGSVLGLTFDPPEVVGAIEARPGSEQRQADFVSWLAPVFAKTDLFLWLPARSLYDDVRFERLLAGSPARGIHFHWIFGLDATTPEEIAILSRLYERAILDTDDAALSRSQDRLIAVLRGQSLRLTTPDGTDLRMRVPVDAWFHKNDGDMSPARAASARGVRDREMEFPSGALRFFPDPDSVEGRLVVRRVPTPEGPAEGVTLDFEGGRARRVSAAKGEAAFLKEWKQIGGDIDRVGEVVLGTNPLLVARVPSGDLPYFGYGAGAVRISMGDNWESGGSIRTTAGKNWWLLLGDASLQAGGRTLILEGRLITE